MNQGSQKRSTLVFLAAGALGIAWLNAKRPRFDVPEVDLPQARALIEAGAVVLDVRNKEAFDYRYLPLRTNGFPDVVNMKPGIEGWADAGLPLVKAG